MALSPRMLELQRAMDLYSEATVRNFRIIHAFGDRLIERIRAYLGEGGQAMGVPPSGEYHVEAGDYHDAKFSTYHSGKLSLAPIQMGLSIGIPHSKDKGTYWPKIVLEFEMEGDAISMLVADATTPVRGFSLVPSDAELDRGCEAIFDYMKDVLENPVRTMTAQGSGRFGFAG